MATILTDSVSNAIVKRLAAAALLLAEVECHGVNAQEANKGV
jgi:hypothetical protein